METLPNMSLKKANELVDKYFEANMTEEHKKSEDMKKTMNGLTSEEVENTVFANKSHYINLVNEKLKHGMADDIVLKPNKDCFYVAFYNDTNYYDLSRPQSKIDIAEKREKIRKQLLKVDPKEKVLIVFGGNLLGEEWKLATLRNASVIEAREVVKEITKAVDQSESLSKPEKTEICKCLENMSESENFKTKTFIERIIAYWGIKKRVEQLRHDIRSYISVANIMELEDFEIILLNGAQEHAVRQKFNFDAMEKVYNSLVKSFPNIKYIDEGVNITFPVYTDQKSENSKHIRMNIQTNSSSKASKASRVANAGDVDSGLTDAPVSFRTNVANFSGYFKGVYYPTGQSMFGKAKRGAIPTRAPQDRDVYKIDITDNEKCEVTRGGTVNFNDFILEKQVRDFTIKNQAMAEVINEAIAQKVNDAILKNSLNKEDK